MSYISTADKAGKSKARGQTMRSAGPSRRMAGGGFLNSKMTDKHFQRFFLAPFCMDHTCSGSFHLTNSSFLHYPNVIHLFSSKTTVPPLPLCKAPIAPAEAPGMHWGCNTNPGRQSPGSEHLHPNPSCRLGCFALVLALRRTLAAGKAARERGQGRVTSCGSGDICLGRGLRTRPKATTEATLASTPPPHHLNQGQPSSALSRGWGTPCRPLQDGGFH